MDCPHCHISNPAGGKFCVQCGSSLGDAIRPVFRDRRSESIFKILGASLGPKFELLDGIGSGGMGYVFLALHRQLNSKVAIKVLHESCNSDPALVERFHREAKAAAQLSHPNIIPIFDIGVAADFNYFVMRYIEGEDLGSILEREKALPLPTALSYASQVARALDYAHRKGIVHRDVKPANILIERDGTAIVTDFGIARMQAAGRLTTKGAIVGTPHYMSPEQARGELVDFRADLYSLGCVLFHMLAGRMPFDASDINALVYKHIFEPPPSPRSWRPEIPEELESIVLRLMAKAPSDRYPDALTLVRSLSRIQLPVSLAPSPELLGLASRVAGSVSPVLRQQAEPASLDAAKAKSGADAIRSASIDVRAATQASPPVEPMPESSSGEVSLEELSSMALKDAYMHSENPRASPPEAPVEDAEKGEITLQELAALAARTRQSSALTTDSVGLMPSHPPESPVPGNLAAASRVAPEADGQRTMLVDAASYDGVEATRLVALDEMIQEEGLALQDVEERPKLPVRRALIMPLLVGSIGAVLVLILLVRFFPFHRLTTTLPAGESTSTKAPVTETTVVPSPGSLAAPGATAPTETLPQVTNWLTQAENAFQARRLTSPANDNALYYYKKAAESPDTRAQAEEGIQKVARAYAALGRTAETAGQKEKARSYFMKALDIDPQFAEAWTAVNRLTESKADAGIAEPPVGDPSRVAKGLVDEPSAAPVVEQPGIVREDVEAPVLPPAKTRSGKVYEATDVDRKPEVLREVAPDYPRSARQKGLEDIIVLRLLISEKGAVTETKVLRGARVDMQFEKAALEAVRKWRFKPAMKGGQAVSVWFNVAVPFQLRK